MIQQILRDMYIDPEILEGLSDDQKQMLFFKMREEQIRRWKSNEDKSLAEEKLKPPVKEDGKKHVKFNCDENSELIIDLIDQPDEIDTNDLKKKQEEEALKKAEEQARKESDLKRKELDGIEKKKKEEIKKKEEAEKFKKAKEEKETEIHRKVDKEAALRAAKVQKEKEATEKQLEIEKKKQAEELAEEKQKRKEEIYEKMKKEQEEKRKYEEEERKLLEDDWKERELKGNAAEQLRRNTFTYSKNKFERMQTIAKEKTELEKMRRNDDIPIETMKINSKTEKTEKIISKKESPKVSQKNYKRAIKRPPVPTRPDALRPTISTIPVNVTSTRDEVDMVPVQKVVISSRPPPTPSNGSPVLTQKETLKLNNSDKPNLPARPKSKFDLVERSRISEHDEEK